MSTVILDIGAHKPKAPLEAEHRQAAVQGVL